MKKLILSFLLLVAGTAFSDETNTMRPVRIIEILDCNLFRTKDQQLIQLANVNSPVSAEADSGIKFFAREIKNTVKEKMLRYGLLMQIADSSGKVLKVHLFRKFDLQLFNFNEYYLKNGFGYYEPNPVSKYSERYFLAAQHANQKRKGLWNERLIRKRTNRFDRRWRLMGGFWKSEDIDNDKNTIPVIGFNYRASKILPVFENKWSYLSLSAEIGSIFILLNHFKIGPEFRIKKRFYLTANYGNYILLLNPFEDGSWSTPFYDICAGFFLSPNGVELELEYTKLKFTDASNLFRVALEFAL